MLMKAALIGQGQLGQELLMKIMNHNHSFILECVWTPVGDSCIQGLGKLNISCANSIEEVLNNEQIQLVFNTSYTGLGEFANKPDHRSTRRYIHLVPEMQGRGDFYGLLPELPQECAHIQLVSPAAQAIVPLVAALSQICLIQEAEVISDIPSKAADSEFRAHLDEYMSATELALTGIGGALQAKSMIFLNPDEESAVNRYIVHLKLEGGVDPSTVTLSLSQAAAEISNDFPGYRLKYTPSYSGSILTFMIEVRSWSKPLSQDYGHMDLLTSSACRAGERWVKQQQERGLYHGD
ncbi:hypothetical protein [Paenibacillus germinis]|nr:hypothetical protein [Paenibacillus germinis]